MLQRVQNYFWRVMEWEPFVWGSRIIAGYMVCLVWIGILGSQL